MSAPHDTNKPVVSTTEARQAETNTGARYVLLVSLGLAILAGIILYFAFFRL
jgi:hypothetical protein